MIYTKMTIRAMRLAYDAHHGQLDQGNMPYVFHPFFLATQMQDEITTCVALLHDLVEDTAVTLEELERQFPPEVTRAVRLLTHEDGVPYLDYVRALAPNPVARTVKLADLAHNSDMDRVADAPEDELARMPARRARYARARAILLEWEEREKPAAAGGAG